MAPCPRGLVMLALALMVSATMPVRQDIEARRRSDTRDRNVVRMGRSDPSLAFQRPARRSDNFLRFGRSQPLTLTTDDLLTLLRAYEDDYDEPEKRSTNFLRFGRDPKFLRFGRAAEEDKEYQPSSELIVNVPPRKNRARDHFLRLGRTSEDAGQDNEVFEDRKKRSASADCTGCH